MIIKHDTFMILFVCYYDSVKKVSRHPRRGVFFHGVKIMKLTKRQFKTYKCSKCVWLKKADQGHYFCLFAKCIAKIIKK